MARSPLQHQALLGTATSPRCVHLAEPPTHPLGAPIVQSAPLPSCFALKDLNSTFLSSPNPPEHLQGCLHSPRHKSCTEMPRGTEPSSAAKRQAWFCSDCFSSNQTNIPFLRAAGSLAPSLLPKKPPRDLPACLQNGDKSTALPRCRHRRAGCATRRGPGSIQHFFFTSCHSGHINITASHRNTRDIFGYPGSSRCPLPLRG